MKKAKLTQVRSDIGRRPAVRATLKALGLGKLGKSKVVPLNPAVSGMIKTVEYLITVESV
jgi:large subunit ribosomal protein L30